MKTLSKQFFIICTILIPHFLPAQSVDNLDRINGYKSLKFQSSIDIIRGKYLLLPTSSDKGIEEYICVSKDPSHKPDPELIKFGTTFQSIFLSFYKGQLFQIKLYKKLTVDEYKSQAAAEKEYALQSDYTLIVNKLIEMFGRDPKQYQNESMILIWETNLNKVEYEGTVQKNLVNSTPVVYLTVSFINKGLYNEAVVNSNK